MLNAHYAVLRRNEQRLWCRLIRDFRDVFSISLLEPAIPQSGRQPLTLDFDRQTFPCDNGSWPRLGRGLCDLVHFDVVMLGIVMK